jgi:hypothetical protein
MPKQSYSEQRKRPDGQPRKRNGQKRTQKLHGSQRGRLSANSLMLKRLEWQPKGENKPAIAPLNPIRFWRAIPIVVPAQKA